MEKFNFGNYISKAKNAWNNEYEYQTYAFNIKTHKPTIGIYCRKKDQYGREHGLFWKDSWKHLQGKQGCPLFGKERVIAARQLTNEDFKERAAIKHNNFYIYDTTDVNNRDEQGKVLIRCPKHGLFRQTPGNHLMGQGCPICRQSAMEKEIALLLQENNIDYIQQHTFKWLKHQRKLRLDFFLPSFNIAIECQGIQHFEEEHFGSTHDQNILPTIQFLDKLKLDLCSKHNITMIYYANYQYDFPYEVITDKANIITKIKNHKVKN